MSFREAQAEYERLEARANTAFKSAHRVANAGLIYGLLALLLIPIPGWILSAVEIGVGIAIAAAFVILDARWRLALGALDGAQRRRLDAIRTADDAMAALDAIRTGGRFESRSDRSSLMVARPTGGDR